MSSNADNDNNPVNAESTVPGEAPAKVLSAAAKRALAEAEERRNSEQQAAPPTEIGGRGGADPARFGDWEINGRAIDF
ncbi:MAG: DUF1674 domain-containing protein [Shinella sp.]|nr:MAG: DUF1674 domain-containing protein [Shinella sp.]